MRFRKKFWILWTAVIILVVSVVLFISLPPKGHIPVLMYHLVLPKFRVGGGTLNVSVDDFHHQMWFLKTFGFRVISLDELYAIKTGQAKPRGREVVITFDDGHETYLHFVLPILERYQIKSTNFLIWDHLMRRWEDDVSLEQARKLADNPLVTLGSHTLTHPNLSQVSLKQVRVEIVESKKKLEEALGKPVHYFCYPSGVFNAEVIRLVEQAGYRLAFTTSRKHLSGYPQTLYSLTRIKVKPREGLFIFWADISGLVDYGKEISAFLSQFFSQLTGAKPSGKLNIYEPTYKTM